jgi:hypothetical protein
MDRLASEAQHWWRDHMELQLVHLHEVVALSALKVPGSSFLVRITVDVTWCMVMPKQFCRFFPCIVIGSILLASCRCSSACSACMSR